ncbi:hypothetical protein [uncultured Bradyrhizobium sp.]|uniref:MoaF-related domain-containing protein n=1 Tax=uncultured Bradyrhizobium sp. TaxID=199684 RepID=UPI0035C9CC25
MADAFPATGHKYLVHFTADDGGGQFRVQLDFHSLTSLTYTGVNSSGAPVGPSETVDITVESIRDMLFLVTWKEQQGTTVVHLEDYKNNMIITTITDPTNDPAKPKFSKYHGTMTQIP